MHSRRTQRSPERQPRSKASEDRKATTKWSSILSLLTIFAVFFYVLAAYDFYGVPAKRLSNPSTDILHFATEFGDIRIILRPDIAPNAVKHFKQLVEMNFFDDCGFYRAEKGFVIQGGGRTKDGKSKNSPLPNFAFESGIPNTRGTIAFARTDDINSANSDYFINLADNAAHLGPKGDNPGYTAFGEVITGLDLLDQFCERPTREEGGLLMLIEMISVHMSLEEQ